jgi:sorting nexin-1/2
VPIPSNPAPSSSYAKDVSGFSVSDPVKGGHTTYTVRGTDNDGPFEGSWWYNDFHAVREILVWNWPGLYVPPIPPKKMTGNKDERFVEDRLIFLDRFMKQMAKNPHLLNSDTFKVFAWPSGDIEKTLNMHPKPTAESYVERFRNVLHVDEFPSDSSVRAAKEVINDFSAFCKRIAPVLSNIKK